jgi:hypothetical protein
VRVKGHRHRRRRADPGDGGGRAARRCRAGLQTAPDVHPITKQIAALVNLNTDATSLDSVQLQRVANLMQEGGMLARPFDVSPILFR